MIKYAAIICTALLLTGCGRTVTGSTHQVPDNEKVIVGYGRSGAIEQAMKEAWIDASEKLKMSGLGGRFGIVEQSSKFEASTAAIVFRLVPLNELETADDISTTDESP